MLNAIVVKKQVNVICFCRCNLLQTFNNKNAAQRMQRITRTWQLVFFIEYSIH